MSEDSSARPADTVLRRYRAGLPPRDASDRDAYRTWSELDAEDLQSALEEQVWPDQEYERYEGPLRYDAWRAERDRNEELQRLGIERPLIPDRYAQALGGSRAWRLERQVADRLLGLADPPPSDTPPGRTELEAQARQLGAAGRALNIELARQVVELEEEQASLVDESVEADRRQADLQETLDMLGDGVDHGGVRAEADAQGAEAQALRKRLGTVAQELHELSAREGSPDDWVREHGAGFADALAARYQLRRGCEQTVDIETPAAAEQAREAPDAGRDLF